MSGAGRIDLRQGSHGRRRRAYRIAIAAIVGAAIVGVAQMPVKAQPLAPRAVPDRPPTAEPIRIEPSAPAIPANTLRFYIHFSANARGVFRQGQVTLSDVDRGVVRDPFINFGQELWSPDGRRLTLLIDPGRIKRGIAANAALGSVLRGGGRYRLALAWTDASGAARELARDYDVGGANLAPLDVRAWVVDAPIIGTRGPLSIRFGRPMDEALLADSLIVTRPSGQALRGSIVVARDGRWTFTPAEPWRVGKHRVHVLDRLEDVSGNRVGEALDHEVGTASVEPPSSWLTFSPRLRLR